MNTIFFVVYGLLFVVWVFHFSGTVQNIMFDISRMDAESELIYCAQVYARTANNWHDYCVLFGSYLFRLFTDLEQQQKGPDVR